MPKRLSKFLPGIVNSERKSRVLKQYRAPVLIEFSGFVCKMGSSAGRGDGMDVERPPEGWNRKDLSWLTKRRNQRQKRVNASGRRPSAAPQSRSALRGPKPLR